MKRILLSAFLAVSASLSVAQTNQINSTGNIGIGTINPTKNLEVNGDTKLTGSVEMDSIVIVKDSIIIDKDAHVKEDLKVDGKGVFVDKIRTNKSIVADKNAIIKKDIFMEGYADSIPQGSFAVMFLDENGKTYPVNKSGLKSIMDEIVYLPQACLQDQYGNTVYMPPTWHNIHPNTVYTGFGNCENFAKVGINTNNPKGYLHIKGYGSSSDDRMLVVENQDNPNGNPLLLQLDANGMLHAREIKVDIDNNWPDYVFEEEYELMPLSDVESYIKKHGHLPNVKSAEEIEKEGLNLGEANKVLMEKVEEMTLYMIQMKKEIDELKRELNEKSEK